MKIPEIWEDCKTKEQQDAFIKDLDRIDRTEKFEPIPFEKLCKELGINIGDLK